VTSKPGKLEISLGEELRQAVLVKLPEMAGVDRRQRDPSTEQRKTIAAVSQVRDRDDCIASRFQNPDDLPEDMERIIEVLQYLDTADCIVLVWEDGKISLVKIHLPDAIHNPTSAFEHDERAIDAMHDEVGQTFFEELGEVVRATSDVKQDPRTKGGNQRGKIQVSRSLFKEGLTGLGLDPVLVVEGLRIKRHGPPPLP
jgi:hypothetical protein